mmetsp:Transcript_16212/g.35923  ORF Transcript_16212/g.35923 Transcript_16212/m.35923 type:complete len:217 (-) Transcript_16212:475-1125(-)
MERTRSVQWALNTEERVFDPTSDAAAARKFPPRWPVVGPQPGAVSGVGVRTVHAERAAQKWGMGGGIRELPPLDSKSATRGSEAPLYRNPAGSVATPRAEVTTTSVVPVREVRTVVARPALTTTWLPVCDTIAALMPLSVTLVMPLPAPVRAPVRVIVTSRQADCRPKAGVHAVTLAPTPPTSSVVREAMAPWPEARLSKAVPVSTPPSCSSCLWV